MGILILGLLLFLGIHLLPMFSRSRERFKARLGDKRYRGVFSVVSLIGFVLIIWGFARAPLVPVYPPFPWARPLAFAVLPLAFILLAAAHMPGHIRAVLKHPMMIGVLLWALPDRAVPRHALRCACILSLLNTPWRAHKV